MAGMTITRTRELRIAFSQSYLSSGLVGLVRRSDTARFSSPAQIRGTTRAVGVVSGTTGDRYVREQCPQASLLVYPTVSAAVDELRQNRIDVLVHDAPVIAWYLGTDEANLAAVLPPLDQEPLGWGLRQGDTELRAAVDAALGRWRSDGTRERILTRWIPFWPRLEEAGRRP
jgi:polar amino acid transport system substrate-binding protein